MFFKDEVRKVDMAHRQDNSKNAIMKKAKEEREKRQMNKKQNESALLLQRYIRSYKTTRDMANQLTKNEQIPKIVGEVMKLMKQ